MEGEERKRSNVDTVKDKLAAANAEMSTAIEEMWMARAGIWKSPPSRTARVPLTGRSKTV